MFLIDIGYITAKGYEKKKAKILSPFQRRSTESDCKLLISN